MFEEGLLPGQGARQDQREGAAAGDDRAPFWQDDEQGVACHEQEDGHHRWIHGGAV